jgi:hypothetical protein
VSALVGARRGRYSLISGPIVVVGLDSLDKAREIAVGLDAARARIGGPYDPLLPIRLKAARWFDRWEATATRSIAAVYARAEREALASLRASKARRGTHLWTREDGSPIGDLALKAVDAGGLFDPDRWGAELEDDAGRWLADLEDEAGQITATQIGVGFREGDPGLAELVAQRATKVGGTSETTLAALQRQLSIAAGRGETIDEVARRVSSVFASAAGPRARVIARTEVVGGANEANILVARSSGVVGKKRWVATLDERTRDSHVAANGQEVDLNAKFTVGGASLDAPGDYNGPPDETIQCRCTMMFVPGVPAGPPPADVVAPTGAPPDADLDPALAKALDPARQAGLSRGVDPFDLRRQSIHAGDADTLRAIEDRVYLRANGYRPGPRSLEIERALVDTGANLRGRAERRARSVVNRELGVSGRSELTRSVTAAKRELAAARAGLDNLDRQIDATDFQPTLDALEAERDSTLRRAIAATRAKLDAEDRLADYDLAIDRARRDALYEDLSAIRPMGGSLSVGGSGAPARVVADSARWYPTDWIEASNASKRPLTAGTSRRGFYQHNGKISLSRRTSRLDPDGSDLAQVAAHELGHRMEHVVGGLREAEWTHVNRRNALNVDDRGVVAVPRTRPLAEVDKTKGGYRADEWTLEDEFVDPYLGKRYGADNADWRSDSEIVAMGMEMIVHGTPIDREVYDLVVGMLASL